MYGRLLRIRPDILIRILLSIIFAFILTGMIKVDSIFYRRAANDQPDLLEVGYPATEQLARVTNIEEIKRSNFFTIEIDSGDLTPTGTYRSIPEHNYYNQKATIWVERASGKVFGQFYVAKLESNEKILLLLDDSALKLNGKMITLPVGQVEDYIYEPYFNELNQRHSLSESDWYVDMAGYMWRQTRFGDQVAAKKMMVLFLSFIGSYILLTLIFHLIINRALKNT